MKAVIIYYSKTGFTRRYAQWLAEAMGCDCVPFDRRMKVRLDDYDVVIFGSWLRAGAIQKLGWFKEQMPNMTGKMRIVFAVGAMPAEAEDAVRKMFDQNFTPEEQERVCMYYLQGGLDYAKMDPVSRAAMKMLCFMLKHKRIPTIEDKATLELIGKSFDASSREAIRPIVNAVGKTDD